jgi:hypothetical protein
MRLNAIAQTKGEKAARYNLNAEIQSLSAGTVKRYPRG